MMNTTVPRYGFVLSGTSVKVTRQGRHVGTVPLEFTGDRHFVWYGGLLLNDGFWGLLLEATMWGDEPPGER